MKNTSKYIIALTALISLSLVVGCEKEPTRDDKIHYDYLSDYMWVTDYVFDPGSDLPSFSKDANSFFCFLPDGRMLVLRRTGSLYSYKTHYNYRIDRATNIITVPSGGEDHYFSFHLLSSTHMTLFYRNNSDSSVSYVSKPLPGRRELNTSSFPPGWVMP